MKIFFLFCLSVCLSVWSFSSFLSVPLSFSDREWRCYHKRRISKSRQLSAIQPQTWKSCLFLSKKKRTLQQPPFVSGCVIRNFALRGDKHELIDHTARLRIFSAPHCNTEPPKRQAPRRRAGRCASATSTRRRRRSSPPRLPHERKLRAQSMRSKRPPLPDRYFEGSGGPNSICDPWRSPRVVPKDTNELNNIGLGSI